MTTTATSITRNRIIAALIVLALIIAAFIAFMNANLDRIVEQNGRYVEGSTEQTARRLNELFGNAQDNIDTVSRIFELTLKSSTVTQEDLVQLSNDTSFDYLLFTNEQGSVSNIQGQGTDMVDREHYQRGMQGESGVCAVYGANSGEGNALVFYTPLRYHGKIIGVMSGVYTEATVSDLLTTYFFGEQTSSYLCDSEGNILARSSNFAVKVDTAFDLYIGEHNDVSYQDMKDAFADGRPVGFTYESSSGLGAAYAAPLDVADLMLLRAFPESITSAMVNRANTAGVNLIIGIVVAFVVFITILLIQARQQKQQLLLENKEATRIIDTSVNLFKRFVIIDLTNHTYEYLKGDDIGSDLPPSGPLEKFRDYWSARVLDGEDAETLAKAIGPDFIREDLTADVPFLQHEYRINQDGGVVWIQASTLCLRRDEDGMPTGVLYTVQDITDVKSREQASREALEEAYRAADQASKAKSDFLNSMSHDIRTPMNSIMGLTAIAAMHIEDMDRVKDCLGKITVASRHLLGLINEVLDMAKIESGKIALNEEDFDLPEAVENLLTIVNPQIEDKQQHLKVDIADITHEHVVGDSMRLQQVFVNIMGNSIKFTPEGGTIGLHIAEKPSRIQGCGCYEFTFTDTGCGMDEEFVKRIFEPFSRARDNRVTNTEGTGLGMSIVKSIVSLMNGTIEVESTLGEGATFVVTIYLKLRSAESQDLTHLAGLNVLVADNDENACQSACNVLEQIGMAPEFVTSGQDAVDRVAESVAEGRSYAAVILDWKMPGMSGVETARRIREVASDDLPIIILSAYDWSAIEQEARRTGVDAFISKPLFRSRLVHVMQDLLSDGDEEVVDEMALLKSCNCEGRRILLTEDNSLAAAIAEDILAMTGVMVERAENGRQAVKMATEHPAGYYDLVLMDIQMPIMNGYEVTEAIRAAAEDGRPDLAKIPIIALTADAFAEDIRRAHAAGMNAHMSKPMEINALVKTLQEWMF